MGHDVHTYVTELSWAGSTAVGYDDYGRGHHVTTAAEVGLDLTSDPAFLGDPSRWNPEQLLVAAASSCQMLTFLAVAARSRLDVVAYRDEATGVMPEADRPVRVTRIDLRTAITLADTERERPTEARLHELVELAHKQCFIANSVSSEIVVTPTFSWVAAD